MAWPNFAHRRPTPPPILQPGPPSKTMYQALVASFILYSLGVGYWVAIKPDGSGWRLFSWHPFLMVCGFVGMFGIGAVTKKLGGYTNTKVGLTRGVRKGFCSRLSDILLFCYDTAPRDLFLARKFHGAW